METKWVHLQIKGIVGWTTVMVPQRVTVEQFKQLIGLDQQSLLTVPAWGFALPDQAVLDSFVRNFDTVYVEL
jgi:hypothetical protein